MSDESLSTPMDAETLVALAWKDFDEWLSRWRDEHPDDDRDDFDLVEEYTKSN